MENPTAASAQSTTPSNNLPIQLTSFIGREREIAKVKRLLAPTHMLTLTGSGGCGKTRLALRVAGELLDSFRDGVWLIELAPLTEPLLVPQTVSSALGLRSESARSIVDQLKEHLKEKQVLLILDNCEHLIRACAELSDQLLHACPRLRILTTSREPLNVTGETTFLVPPLSLPDPGQPLSAKALLQSEAIALFAERARAVQSKFQITPANASAIAQICWRLDGIPLAIELAAARVRSIGAEEIAARLDDRFQLLTSKSRTTLPRQQTLYASIDWSFDLLSETERTLFRRLAVFSGGWTLKAAEEVCAGNGLHLPDPLNLLTNLVDKSLVIHSDKDEPRYYFLETIRQYAREKLVAANEGTALQARHLKYFFNLAEQAVPELKGRQQEVWFERLEREQDNLREALESSLRTASHDVRLNFAGNLFWFWFVRGHLREGSAWLERALTGSEGASASASARARALEALGAMMIFLGEFDRGLGFHGQALALFREAGDERHTAFVLNAIGLAAQFQGDHLKAKQFFEEGLALRRAIGDEWGTAQSLHALAGITFNEGDLERTAALDQESLELYRKVGDLRGVARISIFYGSFEIQRGDSEKGIPLASEGLSLLLQLRDKWSFAQAIESLARSFFHIHGDPEFIIRLLGAAQALRESIGSRLGTAGQAPLDQIAHTIREQLSEEQFKKAWAAGRAMDMEQVIVDTEHWMRSDTRSATRQVAESDENLAGLTERETQVLHWLALGLTNQEIADRLVLSKRTVEAHLRSIFSKLDVTTRSAATRIAMEHKLVQ